MSRQTFDTIIIGSGTSAYYCATGLLEAGQKIAIVDGEPFGGTCALRGCQPKKYLVANAEAIAAASHLVGKGVVAAPETDWPALQKLKNEFLDGMPEASEASWVKKGVSVFRQYATFSAPQEIALADGTTLAATNIVVATGSVSVPLDIPGSQYLKTSDDFLELPEPPSRITFIGGGYISLEFAHIAARAGASVTIVHRSDRILKGFEPELADIILDASRDAGIRFVLEDSPASIEESAGALAMLTTQGETIETDLIVAAAGRTPNLSVLAGDHANIAAGRQGITVNEFLQSTTNPAVYAIGDCADAGPMLATVADNHGKVAAKNIAHGNSTAHDHLHLATSVFTIPSISSVGLTEEQAKAAGYDFRINRGDPTGWPSSLRIGEQHAGYKVLIDNSTGHLIGAHLVRHNAAEVINTFALAIAYKIPANELKDFLWAYPTSTSDLKSMV